MNDYKFALHPHRFDEKDNKKQKRAVEDDAMETEEATQETADDPRQPDAAAVCNLHGSSHWKLWELCERRHTISQFFSHRK